MIVSGLYSIEQYPNENKIVVSLPSTTKTAISTMDHLFARKEKLTNAELYTLIALIRAMYETDNS